MKELKPKKVEFYHTYVKSTCTVMVGLLINSFFFFFEKPKMAYIKNPKKK